VLIERSVILTANADVLSMTYRSHERNKQLEAQSPGS